MITVKNKSPIVSDYIPSIEPATATVEEMDDWIVAIGGEVLDRERFQAEIRSIKWSNVPGENPGDPEFPFGPFI
jgi:hypothetical protein